MDFDEYQRIAMSTDTAPDVNDWNNPNLIEKILGLVGEAGETADKFKKILRDKDGIVSDEDKKEIIKELGDTLWYIAVIAEHLEVRFSDVAKINNEKLASRAKRDLIHGAGDNR